MRINKFTSLVLSLFIAKLAKCSNDSNTTFYVPYMEKQVCAPCKECHDCDLYPEESFYCPSTCKKSKCYNDVVKRMKQCLKYSEGDVSIEKFEGEIHYSCSKYGCNQAYNNEGSGFSIGYCYDEVILDLITMFPENVSDFINCRYYFEDYEYSYVTTRTCNACVDCEDCEKRPESAFYCPSTCKKSKCYSNVMKTFGLCTGNISKYRVGIELACSDYVCNQAYRDEENANTLEECHEHIINELIDRNPGSKEDILSCKPSLKNNKGINLPPKRIVEPKNTE